MGVFILYTPGALCQVQSAPALFIPALYTFVFPFVAYGKDFVKAVKQVWIVQCFVMNQPVEPKFEVQKVELWIAEKLHREFFALKVIQKGLTEFFCKWIAKNVREKAHLLTLYLDNEQIFMNDCSYKIDCNSSYCFCQEDKCGCWVL